MNNELTLTWMKTILKWVQSQLILNQKYADSYSLIFLLSFLQIGFLPQVQFFLSPTHFLSPFNATSLSQKTNQRSALFYQVLQSTIYCPGTILSSPFFSVARWLLHWKEQADRRLDKWRWLSGFTLMGSYTPPQPFSLIPSSKEEGEKMWWGKRLKGWDKDKENH